MLVDFSEMDIKNQDRESMLVTILQLLLLELLVLENYMIGS